MSKSFRSIPGTFDILPDAYRVDDVTIASSASWRHVEQTISDVLAGFGAEEIRTPILEPTELIARGIGQLTDIVSKEMFAFERGRTNYVLRPEITAPVLRSHLQHHLGQRGGVQRLFYIGPCFRAERPQRGRYRQFHQFGVELIGGEGPEADAEVIVMMMRVYEALAVTDTKLRLNSLGDQDSRPRFREALKAYLLPHADRLSDTSRQRLQSNPLRILDTKNPEERALLENAPRLSEFLDGASLEHYDRVKTLLMSVGIDFEEDHHLVRGLDYYTRTAFELESPALGAQSALAGGGRYDLLATEIGSKKPVPAVGFAAGMERLFLAMDQSLLPSPAGPDVYLIALGTPAQSWAFQTAQSLRSTGLAVGTDLLGRSLKAQMREANRCAARAVVIVGDDELSAGEAVIKTMDSGEQHSVDLSSIESAVHAALDGRPQTD